MLLLQVVQKPFWLWIVLIGSVTTLPPLPRPEQELEIDRDFTVAKAAVRTVGKCLETSTLIYVETVIVVKDDLNHVNGTIEMSFGDPILIDCVRLVAKTEHDRSSLTEFKLSGTNVIEISVAERQPSPSKALEYSVYVYATIERNRRPQLKPTSASNKSATDSVAA